MAVSDQHHVMRRFIKTCLLVQTLLKEAGPDVKPLKFRLASTEPIGWRKFSKESPRKSINHAFMWLRKDHSGQDVGSVSCRTDTYENQTSQIRGFNISLFKFQSWPHARLLGLATLFIHILISKIETKRFETIQLYFKYILHQSCLFNGTLPIDYTSIIGLNSVGY